MTGYCCLGPYPQVPNFLEAKDLFAVDFALPKSRVALVIMRLMTSIPNFVETGRPVFLLREGVKSAEVLLS